MNPPNYTIKYKTLALKVNLKVYSKSAHCTTEFAYVKTSRFWCHVSLDERFNKCLQVRQL